MSIAQVGQKNKAKLKHVFVAFNAQQIASFWDASDICAVNVS